MSYSKRDSIGSYFIQRSSSLDNSSLEKNDREAAGLSAGVPTQGHFMEGDAGQRFGGMPAVDSTNGGILEDLSECAKLGLDVADAHSCFIFLPKALSNLYSHGASSYTSPQQACDLTLVAYHSLSTDILSDSTVPLESGLIGWVGKHGRAIHVSPFDRDSRTLGVYKTDQELKSFIGIPFIVDEGRISKTPLYGVLACDSKKSFAFSRLQGKLLERVGEQIKRLIALHSSSTSASDRQASWSRFHSAALTLEQELGIGAVDVLRVQLANFGEIESQLGTESAVNLVEKLSRLIQQAIPETVPTVKLPDGALLLALDTMMVSFHEGRIEAVAQHLAPRGCELRLSFVRGSKGVKKGSRRSLSDLIAGTVSSSTSTQGTLGHTTGLQSNNSAVRHSRVGGFNAGGSYPFGSVSSNEMTSSPELKETKKYEYG